MKFLGGLILGLIVGLLAVPAAVWMYLQSDRVPVSATDPPLPFEAWIVHRPLHARIAREMPKSVPIEASETNLEDGAHVYREHCAFCHGLYGHPAEVGKNMFPRAPQLWAPHRNGVVGVSDDPPGETYWKVANGIRLSGMPSFRSMLNETEMWQVTLLLANADKTQPGDVLTILKEPLGTNSQATQPAPAGPHPPVPHP